MPRRITILQAQNWLKAGFAGLVLALLVFASLLLAGTLGAAQTPGARVSFAIATGSTSGTFFPVGEAIAGLISHPPGVSRCDAAPACGPAGLIASARTSQGAVENLLAVNNGTADSGLGQSDVIAAAARGIGMFRGRKAVHVRVIAALFAEDVHLVVAANSKIRSVSDLSGKRVWLGRPGSGSAVTAREILAAWHVSESSFKRPADNDAEAPALLRAGKIDAYFAIGGVPLTGTSDLLSEGKARLIPIDGAGRDRLLKMVPSLQAAIIPANAYARQPAVATVSARALWIVRDSEPEALVYAITRALFSPANRDALNASHPSAREIGLATAVTDLPAPLHPGAAKFYNEQRVKP
jgi:TRAP transporter TAXI family solute receptor